MRGFFVILLAIACLGGCAQVRETLRPEGSTPTQPQFHNRLQISPSTDLVGV